MLLGVAIVLFYMVDTAASTWGPVYLQHEFGPRPGQCRLATLPYLVATLAPGWPATGACTGSAPWRRCVPGALVAAVALAVIVFAPAWRVAVVGFALLGAGPWVVAPL